MSAYATAIREAIPPLTDEVVAEIEDIMRHSIFHSTLDWQERKLLDRGAREAFAVYLMMEAHDGKTKVHRRSKIPGRLQARK